MNCQRLSGSSRLREPVPRGFTLVELMVVVLIIGILSAMILPEMRGTYADALLRATSRDLVNIFDLAYSRAVSFNQVHRVHFDRSTGKYWLEHQTQEGQPAPGFVSVKDVAGSEGQVDPRIAFELRKADTAAETSQQGPPLLSESRALETDNAEALTFYPDGTAEQAEIRLRDRAGHGLALRLNPITSRVHIVEITQQ